MGTAIKNNTNIPLSYDLYQNYPNPFNPTTVISYQLSAVSEVDLSVYNLIGQKVATLVSGKQNIGLHQLEWDASGFASGVYYYRIKAGKFIDVKKMILTK
ncbi:T9SS type A sorting domain-containing protein [candidate division KSB1 bacterium]|nr:T9SS type A sorting domain-containing protein [candidate division KSB1 bacterium]